MYLFKGGAIMESVLKREVMSNRIVLNLSGVIFFVIAITLSAFIRIPLPFTPVPLTLQTFFVLLSAAFLGMRLGVLTQLIYILLGVIGIPVFTGDLTGLVYLTGPTSGYLFGFVAASIFVARLIKHAKDNLFLIIAVFCLADFLLLLCGATWLKISLHLTWVRSLFIGFIPFLIGDILKASLAAVLFWKLRPRVK
jgi:biotin transport system substrate-specific component